jgi:hypothetical protein
MKHSTAAHILQGWQVDEPTGRTGLTGQICMMTFWKSLAFSQRGFVRAVPQIIGGSLKHAYGLKGPSSSHSREPLYEAKGTATRLSFCNNNPFPVTRDLSSHLNTFSPREI